MQIILPVLLAISQTAPPQAPQTANAIFSPVPASEFTHYFDSSTADLERNVYTNTDLFGFNGEFDTLSQAQTISIELFGGKTVSAHLEHFEHAYGGGYNLRYSIPSAEYGLALFSVMDEEVHATIDLNHEKYRLFPVGDGQATLQLVDSSLNPQCATEPGSNPNHIDPLQNGNNNGNGVRYHAFTVDVMAVYSPEAYSNYTNQNQMYSLINLANFEANTAYSISGAHQRLHLVHIGALMAPEPSTSSWSANRDSLTDPADGVWDEVHAWRDEFGADMVIGIVEVASGGGTSGIATVMESMNSSWESTAFSIVSWEYATTYYSYTHELGHGMGLRHTSIEVSVLPSVNTYCAGYSNGVYRTLMNKSSGTRVLQLSNPLVPFPSGGQSGASSYSENAQTLNETVAYTRNFRLNTDFGTKITTTYSGAEMWAGHLFDITPKEDISITRIDQNLAALAGYSIDMDVYWCDGSYVGKEYDSSQWQLLDSASASALGSGLPTIYIIDGSAITFEAGFTYGIYIDLPNLAGLMTTPGANDPHQNDDIRIDCGSGRGFGGWSGPAIPDKTWNGTLHYQAAAGKHNADTNWNSTNAQAGGFMVDVEVNSDIRVNSFEVNIDDNGDTGVCTVDVYMRQGSYLGSENDRHAWTFIGSDPLTRASPIGTPTRVVLGKAHYEPSNGNGAFDYLDLVAGQTYSFYFHLSSAANSMQRFAYYSVPYTAGNSDITILSGVGRNTTAAPFNGLIYSPRGWSGGINYTASGHTPHIEVDDFVTMALAPGVIQVSKATPNSEVKFALSVSGNGPITTAYGLLALTPPLIILRSIITDDSGDGVLYLHPPSSAAGWQVWFAGLDMASGVITNGATIVIQ
jgi:hypothetical protein